MPFDMGGLNPTGPSADRRGGRMRPHSEIDSDRAHPTGPTTDKQITMTNEFDDHEELNDGEPLPETFAKTKEKENGKIRFTEKEGTDAWIDTDVVIDLHANR